MTSKEPPVDHHKPLSALEKNGTQQKRQHRHNKPTVPNLSKPQNGANMHRAQTINTWDDFKHTFSPSKITTTASI
jgi:hypothetical protein